MEVYDRWAQSFFSLIGWAQPSPDHFQKITFSGRSCPSNILLVYWDDMAKPFECIAFTAHGAFLLDVLIIKSSLLDVIFHFEDH